MYKRQILLMLFLVVVLGLLGLALYLQALLISYGKNIEIDGKQILDYMLLIFLLILLVLLQYLVR